ncbi:pectinesterase inhibitor 12-like [Gastrolobium bilobum]|uniref:pectinesterase inhibitor 12-like n=1 Tax=Gastrolobium bilobum TaxID=150636 RepID=UPI002AB29D72|nr:pectinesterase inhibitor 12-like [Gastrolobium bilobum]
MLQSSFLCFSFSHFLLFLITIPLGTSSTLSNDIIDQTCKKCANQSIILSYNLCSTSLPLIPVSHSTNLQGLALIAMELALENVTNTLATIEKLLDSTSFDNIALGCLKDCLELYTDAAWTIVNSIGVFLSGNYEVTRTWMSSVMEAASTCQKGFVENGEVSPLTKENYNIFQLCGIALCIIHLSTPAIATPS